VPRTIRADGGAAHALSRLSYSGHVVLRAGSSSLTTSSVHPRQSRHAGARIRGSPDPPRRLHEQRLDVRVRAAQDAAAPMLFAGAVFAGHQPEWEESPSEWPQTPPYEWWCRHDEYSA
jgi:hypothetical protein